MSLNALHYFDAIPSYYGDPIRFLDRVVVSKKTDHLGPTYTMFVHVFECGWRKIASTSKETGETLDAWILKTVKDRIAKRYATVSDLEQERRQLLDETEALCLAPTRI